MASKTALLRHVRDLDVVAVRATLDISPGLIGWRDERGRNLLHVCCGIGVSADTTRSRSTAAIDIAETLLARGIDIDEPAFTEDDGRWRATPLWYAIARARNLGLATRLLDIGCDPNHALWAAAFNDDLAAIDLLIAHGADIDPVTEDETPFLGAIKTSRYRAAWLLASRGANVDFADSTGDPALRAMAEKI
ncbi:MAG: hypothetical protein JWM34_3594 [Ilumatobacteraceae bacterium]|nr:hypothetical protein [Ilumatobacteraceae bacterium]